MQKWTSYSENIKDRKSNTHCFDTILKAPHPSCHVLCTSSPPDTSYPFLISWFYPCQAEGRRLLLFLSVDWFYFNTRMSVIEPKDGRRGCVWVQSEGGFNFLLISDFCTIMKGKHEHGEEKQWFCSHLETPWAVESHGWCSHLNQM